SDIIVIRNGPVKPRKPGAEWKSMDTKPHGYWTMRIAREKAMPRLAATPSFAGTNSAATFFFFSSRRRHTSYASDWSSDMCSSDLDLQVWHKLAWIDPLYLDADSRVRQLVSKGRDFSEEDKAVLRSVELELLNRVIPEYRD